jgi:hypothetical protein
LTRLPTGLRLGNYYYTKTFTTGELQVECVVESSAVGGLYRGRGESPPTWQGWFGANGRLTGHPHGRQPLLSAFAAFKPRILVNRRRDVSTKSQAEPTQTLAGRPTPWLKWPGVWHTWSTCQIHPRGDAHFDIWSTSICNPLKCSNLVPKFLKSNKH